ncbi:MAG TPA: polysaccharide lyase family protein [Sedimentisphaerales bacterium]|nr:polysaccharide lyase family protein [Sedimentisphaerales bacterium]
MRFWRILLAAMFVLTAMKSPALAKTDKVELVDGQASIVLRNGLLAVEIDKASGDILRFEYKNTSLLSREAYIDWVTGRNYRIRGSFSIKVDPRSNDGEMAEVVVTQTYDGSNFPMDVAVHHVLRRGVSGLYSFVIFSHPSTYPETGIGQARHVFRPDGHIFDYIAVDDRRQKAMPPPGTPFEVLGPKESTRVTEGPFKGFIEDKYHWFASAGEHFVHGWASTKKNIGIWILYGSNEDHNGGPTKQHNTAHGGPTLLKILTSGHYGAGGLSVAAGEEWSKLYGPWMIYVNEGANVRELWEDAKNKARAEREAWPHAWMRNDLYPLASQRGTVTGRLAVTDPYYPQSWAKGAWVGLAQPLSSGLHWQNQGKEYQFWRRSDYRDGSFTIPNVRPGKYTLYAFVDGVMGEYVKDDITIEAGKTVDLGTLNWVPQRFGRRLWQIGTPDRTAREFRHGDNFRRWGLWLEYPKDFPNDVNFIVGRSLEAKDWNYSQMTREVNGELVGTKWQIHFDIAEMPEKPDGQAVLRIAFAGARNANLFILLNGEELGSTGRFGRDNAMARAGIHGQYSEKQIRFDASLLNKGRNTIVLDQRAGGSPWINVMYDCIRLEVPF